MPLKFKGKTTTGIPVNGTLQERELHFNLIDETIYTSSDGTDVIEIGRETGGTAWSPTANYRLGDMVATTPGGFIHHAVRDNLNQDPATDTGDDWTQPAAPAYVPTTYNFIATDLQTDFICPTSDGIRVAVVWIEGFEVPTAEIDITTTIGTVILNPVSLNSAVKITV